MECEMCGKKVSKTTKIIIDGAVLNVCDDCAKFGTPVIEHNKFKPVEQPIKVQLPDKPQPKVVAAKKPARRVNEEDLDIVEDYAELVKNARERLAMSQADLAAKIFERKNVIASIERGELMPDLKIARKLEKILGITLVEKSS
ncbi:multiprotein bridging factor aMBF1 [Thermoplasma sp.]|uniref:multiprotein bridging factor aMBF1 n=1 Tax=Thermoplasma sp. TaxID=1973142 RepID=UPI00260878E5|nr:multiprotein bridging factor aMBF1 [Thermoplasma sp.]